MIDFKRGQGATEYLLMLAAVLVVVAAAVYFMMGTGPSFMVTPAAGYPETQTGDNTTVIFTVDSITPNEVDADLQVVDEGSSIGSTSGSQTLTSGDTVTINCNSDAIGATLKVTAQGSTKTFTIQEG